jgi:hypothetical protein
VTVKSVALVPVPLAFVTVIRPVVAPEGTTAVILVDETTLKLLAAVPLNLTDVVPVKFVPSIVTVVPLVPLVGENDVIVGDPVDVTVKVPELVADPPGEVTVILPVIAPDGTTDVICVEELTVKVVALVFLNFTPVAPVKFVPVMTTEVPTGPEVGTNEVIVGAAAAPVTVKSWLLVAVPLGVVTVIRPVVAPVGTMAVIWVPEGFDENVVAFVRLNLTAVVPTKFEPLIVTEVPTGPLVGEKFVMLGAHEDPTMKSSVLSPDPSGVVTLIFPVTAPPGTVAVIELFEFTVKVIWSAPPNSTSVAPWKWLPEIVTGVPTGPHAGVNPSTVGAGAASAAGATDRSTAVSAREAVTTTRARSDRVERSIFPPPCEAGEPTVGPEQRARGRLRISSTPLASPRRLERSPGHPQARPENRCEPPPGAASRRPKRVVALPALEGIVLDRHDNDILTRTPRRRCPSGATPQ